MRSCEIFASGISAPRSDCWQQVAPAAASSSAVARCYLLRYRFYVGEVKYKDEILPGEQPAIMDRALFDAVQQKLTDQWSAQSTIRNASDHLLTGLLFDDANHRMVPTHSTKAGIRYRYYSSLRLPHGEAKSASVGSVSRIPAASIEDRVLKALNEHLTAQKEKPSSSPAQVGDRNVILEQLARIDVHQNHLTIRFKPTEGDNSAESPSLSIPWQKPPSRKSRQILVPHGVARLKCVRPGSSDGRAWSTRSHEAAGGLTRSCRAR